VASSSVKLYGKKQAPKHNLIARSVDRAYWTAPIGNLYVCGLAYSGLSAEVTVNESRYINYSIDNNVLNTFWLYQTPDLINFTFSNSVLSSQSLPLTLSLNLSDALQAKRNISLQQQLCTPAGCSNLTSVSLV
jgi:hypothetical protein